LVGVALVSALLVRAPLSWSDESSKSRDKPNASKLDADGEYHELFQALADTIDQIEHNYVKDISRRELLEAAIEGMLTKLDVHSQYITPEELSSFKTSVESQFGGIGIQITTIDGLLAVATPLYGTPAYRAGMRAGD